MSFSSFFWFLLALTYYFVIGCSVEDTAGNFALGVFCLWLGGLIYQQLGLREFGPDVEEKRRIGKFWAVALIIPGAHNVMKCVSGSDPVLEWVVRPGCIPLWYFLAGIYYAMVYFFGALGYAMEYMACSPYYAVKGLLWLFGVSLAALCPPSLWSFVPSQERILDIVLFLALFLVVFWVILFYPLPAKEMNNPTPQPARPAAPESARNSPRRVYSFDWDDSVFRSPSASPLASSKRAVSRRGYGADAYLKEELKVRGDMPMTSSERTIARASREGRKIFYPSYLATPSHA